MQVWSLNELFRLSRAELFGLHGQIATALVEASEGSPERASGLASLRNIAKVLARPNLAPW